MKTGTTLYKEIEVEISLEDFDSKDLIEELENRGEKKGLEEFMLVEIFSYLKKVGCPEELLTPIKDYFHPKIVDEKKLREWLAFCGVGSSEEMPK